MDNIFEVASKQKLRFDSPTSGGVITVEDLWDIDLNALDTMAIKFRKELQDHNEGSLIRPKQKDKTMQLQFDIAAHIIEVRVEERDAAKRRAENLVLAKQLEEVLADKQVEEWKGKSKAALQKQINQLRK